MLLEQLLRFETNASACNMGLKHEKERRKEKKREDRAVLGRNP